MNKPVTEFNHNRFGELLLLAIDGEISKEEFEGLQSQIVRDSQAKDYYYEFLTTYIGFTSYGNSALLPLCPENTADDYLGLLSELSDEEKKAPAVEVFEEKSSQEIAHDVKPVKMGYRFQRRSLFTIVGSIAAILLVVLFFKYTPAPTGQEVATISDSINAKWADSYVPMHVGSRLMDTDPPFMLREGCTELLFDNHARVIIEAPAEFQILTGDQIKLNYGRAYSTVSDQAYGFTVCTPNSKIIDLGTEFGVQVDMYGGVEMHVTKGKTNLLSGVGGQKIDRELSAGTAGKLNEKTGLFGTIKCDRELFVRRINSQNNFIWRGQSEMALADIVGGGRGFGDGLRGSRIDTSNGQWTRLSGLTGGRREGDKIADAQYNPVSSNPFIDGVFVPNGKNGPMVVSSSGHVFEDAPVTSGRYWYGIIDWNADAAGQRRISLDGVLYGTVQQPALLMHANVGITFDLQAIRQNLPDGSVTEFVSVYGIADAYADKKVEPHADFWVLLDGEVKFSKTNVVSLESGVIRIPISAENQYLTLITTEGTNNVVTEETDGSPIFNDWCVWGNPILKIE